MRVACKISGRDLHCERKALTLEVLRGQWEDGSRSELSVLSTQGIPASSGLKRASGKEESMMFSGVQPKLKSVYFLFFIFAWVSMISASLLGPCLSPPL